ncbi:MAG: hypothetical protein V4478_04195 [Patescibacteria group bacterium]
MSILDAPATMNSIPNLIPAVNDPFPGFGIMGKFHVSGSWVNHSSTQIMSRRKYTTIGPISHMRILFQPYYTSSAGAETCPNNAEIFSASLEYVTGQNPILITFNGSRYGIQYANTGNTTALGHGLLSDIIGQSIPANTDFWLRIYKRCSAPPTSPAVSLVAGGSLTVAQAYYYFITTIDQVGAIESGPTQAQTVTVTPTSGNQSARLTWTNNSYAAGVKVYRGTTNTIANSQLLATLLDPVTVSYVDTGAVTPIAVNPPQVQVMYQYQALNYSTDSAAASGTDKTGDNSSLATSGPTNLFHMATPHLILANDRKTPSVMCLGDSIGFGAGISKTTAGPLSIELSGWFNKGIDTSNTVHRANFSISSSTIAQFVLTGSTKWSTNRYDVMKYADYVVSNLAINDLNIGTTWQQLALYHIQLAQGLYRMGKRYVITTCTPETSSTNCFITTANQTKNAIEAVRLNYNLWIRNGMQVDGSGTPVLSGGTRTPYIYSYCDLAISVEVDASNNPSTTGGYWKIPSSPLLTGQVLTGTPSLTSLTVAGTPYTASSMTVQGLQTYVITMTSGAASGQSAVISSNTANVFTLFANGDTTYTGAAITGLTTIPSVGDTFSIYQTYVCDGLHPSVLGHAAMAAVFDTFVTGTLIPYGANGLRI